MLLVAGEAKVGTGSIAHPTESTVKRLKSNEGERERKKILGASATVAVWRNTKCSKLNSFLKKEKIIMFLNCCDEK
jgi:hypothetical protein